ncbi:DUF4834 family protein [Flavobacterium sp.]|jgi:hypothetical protein|uniref:DUF4834 family protein n=1 Tax=Flavobacterium sp. TaxID=239 RepID=UPI0022CCD2AF|nr:DUF4834 family protein [Flavobacterium sp.]MCZ8228250.1 DUF4834 family protein [Flavobacterium sp.]
MQLASFSGFVRTLLYMIMFYYVFKFLAKLFLPILVKKAVEKAGENFQQQQQYAQQQYTQQQYAQNNRRYSNQDEIIVDTARSKNPKETKKVGEYVDYEEID